MAHTTAAQRILPGPRVACPQRSRKYWEIIDRYRTELMDQAAALTCNRADAEEIVQETFSEAFRIPERLAATPSIGVLLRTINKRNAIDRCRRNQIRKESHRPHTDGEGSSHPVTGGFRMLELREDIAKVIDTLPEQQRAIIIARFWERRSFEEIALRLGLPRSTVWQRLSDAYGLLRRRLGHLLEHSRADRFTALSKKG